jgi:hypothetical protein
MLRTMRAVCERNCGRGKKSPDGDSLAIRSEKPLLDRAVPTRARRGDFVNTSQLLHRLLVFARAML